jgi:hypothetical protein
MLEIMHDIPIVRSSALIAWSTSNHHYRYITYNPFKLEFRSTGAKYILDNLA